MSTDQRKELIVRSADDREVDQTPSFCYRHTGERLRAAWRIRGRRIWHFYHCPICDGH